MIRKIKHQDIDFNKYNACLHASINYKIFAEAWYLDTVADRLWDCYVWEDYRAIMPITYRKKWGLKYVAQPLFCQQLGIFYSEMIPKEIFKAFEKKLHRNVVRSYCFNHDNTIHFQPKGVLNKNYELSLEDSYEMIYKKFSKGTKAEIKVAIREKVFLEPNYNSDEILTLNMSIGKYKMSTDFNNKFLQLLKHLKEQSRLLQYHSVYKNKIVGFIVVIKNRECLQYLFSGTTELGKKLGVSHFQLHYMMQNHSNRKLRFDFLGSELVGVAKYFRSFNPDLKPFTNYTNVNFL